MAGCCSVLQCVAACCSVLQHVAACCSVLQHVPVCSRLWQCVAVCCHVVPCVAVCYIALQCVAAVETDTSAATHRCNAPLQRTAATHCTAVRCSRTNTFLNSYLARYQIKCRFQALVWYQIKCRFQALVSQGTLRGTCKVPCNTVVLLKLVPEIGILSVCAWGG